ncbi:diguanylate cyclase, partial [Nostoc sp. CHAB 5834]|nr:diguanylate cyclase [Nostoc sp. CHAB 5834]
LFAETPIDANGVELHVTASFGVCGLDSNVKDVDEWLAAADAFLYAAKAGGRNCCHGSVHKNTEAAAV